MNSKNIWLLIAILASMGFAAVVGNIFHDGMADMADKRYQRELMLQKQEVRHARILAEKQQHK